NSVLKNPHAYLMNKVNTLPIEELSSLYSSILAGKSYPVGTKEYRLIYKLVSIFNEVYADTSLMNQLLQNSLKERNINVFANITYRKDPVEKSSIKHRKRYPRTSRRDRIKS